ncbi:MAG TPA: hypothetical protein V6D20_18390 [Candidatus Obscuribacterales bacterium]
MDRKKGEAIERAQLQFVIAQCSGAKKSTGARFKLNDFIPKYAKQKETPEQQEERLKSFFRGLASKPKKKE